MSLARSELGYSVAGVLGQGLVGSLCSTVRFERVGLEHVREGRSGGRPVLFLLWHEHLLPLIYLHRGTGAVVLVSEHADGEYITRVMRRLGYGTVRGSSTRGGVGGLRGLVRAARVGRDLAITPDGPQGPRRVLKPGALLVAQMEGLAIIPVAVGASRAWRLGSWDRFMVPRPLTRVSIAYGTPSRVARESGEAGRDAAACELDAKFSDLCERVGEVEATPPPRPDV